MGAIFADEAEGAVFCVAGEDLAIRGHSEALIHAAPVGGLRDEAAEDGALMLAGDFGQKLLGGAFFRLCGDGGVQAESGRKSLRQDDEAAGRWRGFGEHFLHAGVIRGAILPDRGKLDEVKERHDGVRGRGSERGQLKRAAAGEIGVAFRCHGDGMV